MGKTHNPPHENAKAFLRELAALLRKYEASIEALCDDCSDLHGVTGMKIGVGVGHWQSRDHVRLAVCDGWDLDARELHDWLDNSDGEG